MFRVIEIVLNKLVWVVFHVLKLILIFEKFVFPKICENHSRLIYLNEKRTRESRCAIKSNNSGALGLFTIKKHKVLEDLSNET